MNVLNEQFGKTANLPTLDSPNPVVGGPYFNTITKNFAPRVAIAWDPTDSGKISNRTGFGVYDLLPLHI
jgi:hypothetical protein